MLVSIEVVAGNHVGRRLELKPGQRGHVGKAAWAELSLPDDSIAGIQATFECGHAGCTFKVATWDRKILLNGVNILDGKHDWKQSLADQSEITIGDVKLLVHVSGGVSRIRDVAFTVSPPKAGDVYRVLAAAQPLYAILDAARDPRILPLVQLAVEENESLYDGYKALELDTVAPYLIRLPAHSKLLPDLVEASWGNSWGVYLTSSEPFADVRKHLRRFLTVETPKGQRALFRFYDPRVLRAFLPACTLDEVWQFFGPISAFLVEGKTRGSMMKFSADAKSLRQEVMELNVAATALAN